MNEQGSRGCGSCKGMTVIPIRRDKWGKCAFCIAVAIVGTVIGWSFTLSFVLLYPHKQVVTSLALVSFCFTMLLVGHVVAYRRRQREAQAESAVIVK